MLSYTYPRQLARQKAMAEIEVVEIKKENADLLKEIAAKKIEKKKLTQQLA